MWKDGDQECYINLRGCEKHIKQIRQALSRIQGEEKEKLDATTTNQS